MNKPKMLQKGDKVAILCLSSGILGEEKNHHQLVLGCERLRKMGLEPVIMNNALKGVKYLKENPDKRAEDLKQAFYDDSIKGIICAIGGDDTYRTLPYLMEDKKFIEAVNKNPKVFTGFSDTTINHLMFQRIGMNSFYGPNFSSDIAELEDDMLPYTREAFLKLFNNSKEYEIKSSSLWYDERKNFNADAMGTKRVSHKEIRGYEVLQGKGKVNGRLLGGCLESLYDILTNTRYEGERAACAKYKLFPDKEQWKDKILFIETCEERPTPELFEKELLALKEEGVFESVNGIIVGKPQDEVYYEEYKAKLIKVIDNIKMPVICNMNFGHASPRTILPYGLMTEINTDNKTVTVKEPFFQD